MTTFTDTHPETIRKRLNEISRDMDKNRHNPMRFAELNLEYHLTINKLNQTLIYK